MNYRHAYHAGNFGDVFKHVVLSLILDHLRQKQASFFVLDTHAGRGLYDLQSIEAQKTGDAQSGILRLWPERANRPFSNTLSTYFSVLKSFNMGENLHIYPGSPLIIKSALRAQDRAVFVEAHPEEYATLAKLTEGAHNIRVQKSDGWQAVKSLLPPPQRRGIVLIDPPYEQAYDFVRLGATAREGLKRFATGIYLLWYPLKGLAAANRLAREFRSFSTAKILRAELRLRRPNHPKRLDGAGLMIINLPWKLHEHLQILLPDLATLIRTGRGGGHILEWLSEA